MRKKAGSPDPNINNQEKLPMLCIDKGGTFTDCLYYNEKSELSRFKLLSSGLYRFRCSGQAGESRIETVLDEAISPKGLQGCVITLFSEGSEQQCRIVSVDADRKTITLNEPLGLNPDFAACSSGEDAPVFAARLLTGTPPGSRIPPVQWRLAGTQTTNALLEKKIPAAALVVSQGFADLLKIGSQQRPDLFSLSIAKPEMLYKFSAEADGVIDTHGNIITPADLTEIEKALPEWKRAGVEVVAVSLRNAWKNPEHEQQVRRLLVENGFKTVVLSSETARLIHYLDRTQTTLVNAVLEPVLRKWRSDIGDAAGGGSKLVMSSSGGLKPFGTFQPVESLLSGPAAGVAGAMAAGADSGFSRVLSFDMGGTSTDVSRIDGTPELTFVHTVGDARVMAPAVDIETVAAGGGSVCSFDGHRLRVGPESAGAEPGPAAYGKGGPLTLTDLNLLSGRIPPEHFSIPIDVEASKNAFDDLVSGIESATGAKPEPEKLMADLFRIANERMADAIRAVSVRRGFSPDEYALVSFGGAGGQHACDIAENLGIKNIIFPGEASVLSAWGLMHSSVTEIQEQQLLMPASELAGSATQILKPVSERITKKLQTVSAGTPEFRTILLMRLKGQDTVLQVEFDGLIPDDAENRFREAYRKRYGILPGTGAAIEVESVRVIGSVKPETGNRNPGSAKGNHHTEKNKTARETRPVMLGDSTKKIPLLDAEAIPEEDGISGPALIKAASTAVFLKPGWSAERQQNGSIRARLVEKEEGNREENSGGLQAARLELAGNRLQGIANEMGEVLRRTAVSVNIKERLDYSCAIFDADGYLVANAAHIPVHLGALGLCVRSVMKTCPPEPDTVVVTNHPAYGGSHLPDVTVVTPCYSGNKLLGFTASRAHHAEIGGIRPGSMSPDARHLGEEGCVIPPFQLIHRGKVKWDKLEELLRASPWPSRNPNENLADIESAVAANRLGSERLLEWAAQSGTDAPAQSMAMILDYGEKRALECITGLKQNCYEAEEQLDDGTTLKACITLENNRLKVDFDGTSGVHPGNLNATPAIVHSVVMYVMRLLVNEPVPLNEGLLRAVDIQIPESLLNPEFSGSPEACPAVFGGNTEISQRLTDTLIKALQLSGCSQGTMNNVMFGNSKFGFYETIGGGTGAGPGFNGSDAVHHHMTNTRITDSEVMESRYPVRVNRFEIRRGSGGEGVYRGGNGVIRELEFLEPVSLTMLAEHRKVKPFGIKGGKPGATGNQYLIRSDGKKIELSGRDKAETGRGDRFVIETPGGGGCGSG